MISMEGLTKDKIKYIIESTIKEEKKYKSDYLGIAKYLYQNDYDYYENNNINNLINNIESNININNNFILNNKGDEKYGK